MKKSRTQVGAMMVGPYGVSSGRQEFIWPAPSPKAKRAFERRFNAAVRSGQIRFVTINSMGWFAWNGKRWVKKGRER